MINRSLFGHLAELAGHWEGCGFNVLTVPDKSQPHNFRIIAQPYTETLIIKPFTVDRPGVPNRKLEVNQFIPALEYTQDIKAKDVKGKEVGIHHENGLWLKVNPATPVGDRSLQSGSLATEFIARQSSVPHGNSLLAGGTSSSAPGQRPAIFPDKILPLNLPLGSEDYLQAYYDKQEEFALQCIDFIDPNQNLIKVNENVVISGTTVFQVGTDEGGIISLPFFKAPPAGQPFPETALTVPKLSSIFWVNEIDNGDQPPTRQLQYSQNTTIQFFQGKDKKDKEGHSVPAPITWPHIDVATLKEVLD